MLDLSARLRRKGKRRLSLIERLRRMSSRESARASARDGPRSPRESATVCDAAPLDETDHTGRTTSQTAAAEEADVGLSERLFRHMLLSDVNSALALEHHPQRSPVAHAMDLPYSCYFINSSHNTYCTGRQLQGRADAEMYRKVLLLGCRCVEIDVWDDRRRAPRWSVTSAASLATAPSASAASLATAPSASAACLATAPSTSCCGPAAATDRAVSFAVDANAASPPLPEGAPPAALPPVAPPPTRLSSPLRRLPSPRRSPEPPAAVLEPVVTHHYQTKPLLPLREVLRTIATCAFPPRMIVEDGVTRVRQSGSNRMEAGD